MDQLKQPQTRKILLITSVVTFLCFLDTHLLLPVMSLYAAELGASVGIRGLIIGLYSITNTPANILRRVKRREVGYNYDILTG